MSMLENLLAAPETHAAARNIVWSEVDRNGQVYQFGTIDHRDKTVELAARSEAEDLDDDGRREAGRAVIAMTISTELHRIDAAAS